MNFLKKKLFEDLNSPLEWASLTSCGWLVSPESVSRTRCFWKSSSFKIFKKLPRIPQAEISVTHSLFLESSEMTSSAKVLICWFCWNKITSQNPFKLDQLNFSPDFWCSKTRKECQSFRCTGVQHSGWVLSQTPASWTSSRDSRQTSGRSQNRSWSSPFHFQWSPADSSLSIGCSCWEYRRGFSGSLSLALESAVLASFQSLSGWFVLVVWLFAGRWGRYELVSDTPASRERTELDSVWGKLACRCRFECKPHRSSVHPELRRRRTSTWCYKCQWCHRTAL